MYNFVRGVGGISAKSCNTLNCIQYVIIMHNNQNFSAIKVIEIITTEEMFTAVINIQGVTLENKLIFKIALEHELTKKVLIFFF